MSKKIYGAILLAVGFFVAFDTYLGIQTRDVSGRDFLAFAVCIFLIIRGLLVFTSGKR